LLTLLFLLSCISLRLEGLISLRVPQHILLELLLAPQKLRPLLLDVFHLLGPLLLHLAQPVVILLQVVDLLLVFGTAICLVAIGLSIQLLLVRCGGDLLVIGEHFGIGLFFQRQALPLVDGL